MKLSQYNHIISSTPEYTLLYNALTGSFLSIDPLARKLYDQISEGKTPTLEYPQAETDLQDFKQSGIVVDNDVNEIQYLQDTYRSHQSETKTLIVTIAPTLQCNFRCTYCYESPSGKNIRMTKETKEKTVTFIQNHLKDASSLTLAWYGGEPLLEMKTIQHISETFKNQCKIDKKKYAAVLVTNGYLLDVPTAHYLRDYGISTIQVTIDGPKTVHDTRRILSNGTGTYERIITNLTNIIDIIPLIRIRVNVDRMNIHNVGELLDYLTSVGLRGKVHLYFAPVFGNSHVCRDVSDDYFSDDVYANFETDLFKTIIQKGYGMLKFPRPMTGGCDSLHKNSFLIDPQGDIYKCWKTIGISSEKIGSVYTPVENHQNHVKWLTWDPFSFKKCTECAILPVCMGGCAYQPITKQVKEPVCSPWKKNLHEMLMLYHESHKK